MTISFGTIAMLVLVLIGFVGVVRDWRPHNEDDPHYRQPSYWFWGSESWFAFRRLGLVAQLGVIIFAIGAFFPNTLFACGIAILAGLVPLALTIALLNKPRLLVPPALRAQSGALTAYVQRHRRH
jgi:hypothetical protein